MFKRCAQYYTSVFRNRFLAKKIDQKRQSSILSTCVIFVIENCFCYTFLYNNVIFYLQVSSSSFLLLMMMSSVSPKKKTFYLNILVTPDDPYLDDAELMKKKNLFCFCCDCSSLLLSTYLKKVVKK